MVGARNRLSKKSITEINDTPLEMGSREIEKRRETNLPRVRVITKHESEVVRLVSEGLKNKEVTKKMGIIVKTVETHWANIMNKLGLRNVAELIRYAIQKRIVKIEFERWA